MNLFKGNSAEPIGVDLDGRCIRAIQMAPSAHGSEVKAAMSMPRTDPNQPIDEKELRRFVQLLAKRGFTGNEIVIAIPSDKLMTGILELPPRRTGVPVERIALGELSRMHKVSPATLEMASWALPVPERAADTEPVMVAACSYSDSSPLLDAFESLGYSVLAIDIRPWALSRACHDVLDDAPSMTAILEIGWYGAELVGFQGSMVIYHRRLDDAGVLQLGKKLAGKPIFDAEAIQQLVGNVRLGDQEGSDSGTHDDGSYGKAAWHFDGVAGELEVPVAYLQHQYPDGYVTKLLLTGPGALIQGVDTHMAAKLDLEVQVVSPAKLATCPPELADDCDAAATVAMGLAQYIEG